MLKPLRRRVPSDRKTLIQLVHIKAAELQLADDMRRDLQRQATGVESCKDMTIPQLQDVVRRLSFLADQAGLAKPRPRKRSGRDERLPDEVASIEQTRYLEHLFDDVGMSVGTARMRFCRRVCGQAWPQSRDAANRVCEALKAMRARGWRATRATT